MGAQEIGDEGAERGVIVRRGLDQGKGGTDQVGQMGEVKNTWVSGLHPECMGKHHFLKHEE